MHDDRRPRNRPGFEPTTQRSAVEFHNNHRSICVCFKLWWDLIRHGSVPIDVYFVLKLCFYGYLGATDLFSICHVFLINTLHINVSNISLERLLVDLTWCANCWCLSTASFRALGCYWSLILSSQ
jgi:hypothetical protein